MLTWLKLRKGDAKKQGRPLRVLVCTISDGDETVGDLKDFDEFGVVLVEAQDVEGIVYPDEYERDNVREGAEWYIPWRDIASLGVIDVKLRCIKVEYDEQYTGDDYSGVGQDCYLPTCLIDQSSKLDPENATKVAFESYTKLGHGARKHIVHYSPDEFYDQHGDEWEEDDDD